MDMSKEPEETKSETIEEINGSTSETNEVNVEVVPDPETGDGLSADADGSVEKEDDSPVTLERKEWNQIEAKVQKADEYWDRFVRLNAEFDNFKKRAARERSEAVKYANEALMERLIPTLDHFEMAMTAVQNIDDKSVSSIKMGIEMVHNQLKSTLKDSGLEEVDALGKVFDPVWHEAVSQKVTDDVPEGQVVEQTRKGYKLNDRLIRPAAVVVAKAPSAEGESQDASE
jgi:molecular chaperone GrpE